MMRFIILSLILSLNGFSHDFTTAFARVLQDQRIPLPPENINATKAAQELGVNLQSLPKSIKSGRSIDPDLLSKLNIYQAFRHDDFAAELAVLDHFLRSQKTKPSSSRKKRKNKAQAKEICAAAQALWALESMGNTMTYALHDQILKKKNSFSSALHAATMWTYAIQQFLPTTKDLYQSIPIDVLALSLAPGRATPDSATIRGKDVLDLFTFKQETLRHKQIGRWLLNRSISQDVLTYFIPKLQEFVAVVPDHEGAIQVKAVIDCWKAWFPDKISEYRIPDVSELSDEEDSEELAATELKNSAAQALSQALRECDPSWLNLS